MRVCLIFPRFRYMSGDPPLGLLYIASYLKTKSISVSIIDTGFEKSFHKLKKRLINLKPTHCGIYMDSLMFNDALRCAKIAKSLGSFVVIGGPHPSIDPYSVIHNKYVDAVITGEGEVPMYDLLIGKPKSNTLIKKGREIKSYPGKFFPDLSKLPMPDWNLIDLEKYTELWYHDNNAKGTSIITSRGCPYNCSFCQPTLNRLFGKKIRHHTHEQILHQLNELKKRGISSVHLQDDISTLDTAWMQKFCEVIKPLNISWSCNSRVDTLDSYMLKKMKSSGLREIRLGIESFSWVRNDIYNKNISLSQIKKAINLLKANKIRSFGYFILGGPSESFSQMLYTISAASSSDLDAAVFSIFSGLPGTRFFNQRNSIDYYHSKNINLSILNKYAYLRFYLSPKRIRQTIKENTNIKRTLLKFQRF